MRWRELDLKLLCNLELQRLFFFSHVNVSGDKSDDSEFEPGFIVMSWTLSDLLNKAKVHVHPWLFFLKKDLGWFFT